MRNAPKGRTRANQPDIASGWYCASHVQLRSVRSSSSPDVMTRLPALSLVRAKIHGGHMGLLGSNSRTTKPDYGPRVDGTRKGRGFFGELPTKDGSVATEISVGVDFGQGEMEIPALVPTLSPWEIQHLLDGNEPDDSIMQKAVDHARQRISQGLSPFAD